MDEDLTTMERASLYLTQPFGLLSFLACLCVALEAGADWRAGDSKMVTRIQCWLQIPMSILSLMYGLSFVLQDASHDANTCQVQGMLTQFGMVGCFGMDLSLSLSYLLVVKCAWSEEQLRSLEKWLHMVVWPLAVGPAVYLAIHRDYAMAPHLCWIANCNGDAWCQLQHQRALWYRSGVHLLSLVHVSFSVYVISQVFAVMAAAQPGQETVRKVARRAILYAGSVLVVQLPFSLVKLASLFVAFDARSVGALAGSTIPLAGLLNLLVFMLNRRNMRTTYGWMWRRLLDALCCIRPTEEAPLQLMARDLFATTVVEENDNPELKVLNG